MGKQQGGRCRRVGYPLDFRRWEVADQSRCRGVTRYLHHHRKGDPPAEEVVKSASPNGVCRQRGGCSLHRPADVPVLYPGEQALLWGVDFTKLDSW